MNKLRLALVPVVAVGAALTVALPALAAVTFDSSTGAGFVGKGDVQLVLNYNNKQLNDNADKLAFAYKGERVTEVSWVCTNTKNENIQERERTTTTSTEGVVAHTARDNKKQITGFHLTGYNGSKTQTSATEGPKLDSCPTNWTLSAPAGDATLVSESGGLTVNGEPLQ